MTLDEFIKRLQEVKKSRKGSGKFPVTFEMERLEDVGDVEIRDNQGVFKPDPERKGADGTNIDPKTKRPFTTREEISIITLI